MRTVVEVVEKIEREAVKRPEVRVIERMQVGHIVRQGDLYIMLVAASHPKGELTTNRQLVRGTTQGARHVAVAQARVFAGVKLPPGVRPGMPIGPRIVAEKRLLVEHPEHAHVSLPAGHYQTWYQLDPRTMAQVQD